MNCGVACVIKLFSQSYTDIPALQIGHKMGSHINPLQVAFQVKLLDNLDAKLDGEKGQLHEARGGWTFDEAPLLLGEGKNSVCYSSSGEWIL